jgi:Flp pilus assembly pilin Flp
MLAPDRLGTDYMLTFIHDEGGQDLIEYTLLLAFIALVGAAVFIGMGNTTSGLWTIVNSRLASANQTSGS